MTRSIAIVGAGLLLLMAIALSSVTKPTMQGHINVDVPPGVQTSVQAARVTAQVIPALLQGAAAEQEVVRLFATGAMDKQVQFVEMGSNLAMMAKVALPPAQEVYIPNMPQPPDLCKTLKKLGFPCIWETNVRTGNGHNMYELSLRSPKGEILNVKLMKLDLSELTGGRLTSVNGVSQAWLTNIKVATWAQQVGLGRYAFEVSEIVARTLSAVQGEEGLYAFQDSAGWWESLSQGRNLSFAYESEADRMFIYWLGGR